MPALEYLAELNVDVSTAVKLVVATHAHDDHVGGLAKILAATTSARLVCSIAFDARVFYADLARDRELEKSLDGRVRREIDECFQILAAQPLEDGEKRLKWAIEGRPLLAEVLFSGMEASVTCLSPSDTSVDRARMRLAASAAMVGASKRGSRSDPNEASIALWVSAQGRKVLLGADLLTGPAHCGWDGVLATHAPAVRADVYKAAHHGGESGDHPGIWENLLTDDPVVLLTPHRVGRWVTPSDSDVINLCRRAGTLYSTADSRRVPRDARTRATAAALGQIARDVRDPWGFPGHVRVRSRSSGGWSVDTRRPARKLC